MDEKNGHLPWGRRPYRGQHVCLLFLIHRLDALAIGSDVRHLHIGHRGVVTMGATDLGVDVVTHAVAIHHQCTATSHGIALHSAIEGKVDLVATDVAFDGRTLAMRAATQGMLGRHLRADANAPGTAHSCRRSMRSGVATLLAQLVDHGCHVIAIDNHLAHLGFPQARFHAGLRLCHTGASQ